MSIVHGAIQKQQTPGQPRVVQSQGPAPFPGGHLPAWRRGCSRWPWTARRSGARDQAQGASPLHLVSTWADEARQILGQRRVDRRSHASTAIPELLETLALDGCIVTIDRVPSEWSCQKRMAQTNRDRDTDYVMGLKGNQPRWHEAVAADLVQVLA